MAHSSTSLERSPLTAAPAGMGRALSRTWALYLYEDRSERGGLLCHHGGGCYWIGSLEMLSCAVWIRRRRRNKYFISFDYKEKKGKKNKNVDGHFLLSIQLFQEMNIHQSLFSLLVLLLLLLLRVLELPGAARASCLYQTGASVQRHCGPPLAQSPLHAQSLISFSFLGPSFVFISIAVCYV